MVWQVLIVIVAFCQQARDGEEAPGGVGEAEEGGADRAQAEGAGQAVCPQGQAGEPQPGAGKFGKLIY